MSTLATILNTLVVILAVLLIALILVQPSKSGGGFGSAFGGLGESVFGAQAMSHLSKLTVWCMSILFVLTLASAIVAGHIRTSDSSVVQEESSIALTGSVGEETAASAAEAVKPAAETASEAAALSVILMVKLSVDPLTVALVTPVLERPDLSMTTVVPLLFLVPEELPEDDPLPEVFAT